MLCWAWSQHLDFGRTIGLLLLLYGLSTSSHTMSECKSWCIQRCESHKYYIIFSYNIKLYRWLAYNNTFKSQYWFFLGNGFGTHSDLEPAFPFLQYKRQLNPSYNGGQLLDDRASRAGRGECWSQLSSPATSRAGQPSLSSWHQPQVRWL